MAWRGSLAAVGVAAALASGCGGDSQPATDAKGADATATDSQVQDATATDAQGSDSAGGDASQGDTSRSDVPVAKPVLTPRPLRFDVDLLGVWGSGPDDIWMSGDKGTLLHWNGKTLLPWASGTSVALRAVGGTGASDVWMAGDGGTLLHWNGQQLASETVGDAQTVLRAVHASPDGALLLAVGDNGVIYRRQGDAWKLENTSGGVNLHAVVATGAGQAWAAGAQGQALKLSGGSWTTTSLPKANVAVRALGLSPQGRLYAVGDEGYLAATSGTTWEATLANDSQNPPRALRGVWGVSDIEAWAIGDKGVLLHLSGKKWLLEDIAGTYMKLGNFKALWGQTKNGVTLAVAVGDNGAGVRFDAQSGKWQDLRAETTADLRQVVTLDDGSLVACGTAGAVLRAADASAPFYDLAAPVTAADVADCAAFGGGVAIAGPSGLVGLWQAATGWKLASLAGDAAVTGLAATAEGLLAVADDGSARLLLADGSWSSEVTANQLPLRSVAVAGKTAFAVGEAGTVLRRDAGGAWTAEPIAESANLHRVIGWGDGEALAVGDAGAIWLRQGGKWQKVFEAPDLPLYGAVRKADGTLIAVGWSGSLVTGKAGGTFTRVNSSVANVLRGIASTAKGTVAVGLKGGVFQVAEELP